MSKFYILGIDQSTQGTKALIFDDRGKILSRYDLPHKQIISENGWVSHDAEEIYDNLTKVIQGVIEKSGIDKKSIRCMGISNQRETTVVWDRETGKPLDYAIVWQCNRAKDICRKMEKLGCQDVIYAKTGLKLSPYFPASKMSWFMENVPAAKKLSENGKLALGTVDSWLVYKLTGGKSFKTDYSNASRTQLFNLTDLKWDKEICDIFGITMDSLPEVCDSNAFYGNTDLEGYFDTAIPICGVLGDSHGALFGHNCRGKGKIKATYGTGSSIMLNIGDRPVFSKHGIVTSLAWGIDGKVDYVLEGNINYTGAVISWIKNDVQLIESAEEAGRLAKQANPADRTYLVPAFTGLGAPYWKSDAHGILVGLSRSTGKNEIVRAACDCISYQINDIVEAMAKDTGLDIRELCVDGGPTKNDYLMQFQSDISDLTVNVPSSEELSAMGAAFMAGMSIGLYDIDKVYETISYQFYHKNMPEELRREKIDGWKSAVNMLL